MDLHVSFRTCNLLCRGGKQFGKYICVTNAPIKFGAIQVAELIVTRWVLGVQNESEWGWAALSEALPVPRAAAACAVSPIPTNPWTWRFPVSVELSHSCHSAQFRELK